MRSVWFILCVVKIVVCIEHDFKGFDDSILFGINWPGAPENLEKLVDEDGKSTNQDKDLDSNLLRVTTQDQEQYECKLPEVKPRENSNVAEYDGPSPLSLLKPLFSQKICSFRLESYWSYEVCHGRYIRQYHEERDGKTFKMHEYILGHWTPEKQAKLEEEEKVKLEELKSGKAKEVYLTTKVEGFSLPYVEMVFEDGTVCDLSGKPRVTRVRYVCYTHGKHEVSSFKETSTCEYEIIVLSPLLCDHPAFRPKDVSENMIDCRPIGDAPKKPRSLLRMEVDSIKSQHQSMRLMAAEKDKDVLAVFKVEKIDKDGETHLKFELHSLDEPVVEDEKSKAVGQKPQALPQPDENKLRAFLNGEDCLHGGTGWWKYEFCYGRHVTQYHVDRAGSRTTLMLGRFDKQAHLDWIKENKAKAPKPLDVRTSISHFYANGDICDKTGRPRQTEVKLKCIENASNPSQVSLYLLEPRTCHYILGVESSLICDILPLADDNGLVKMPQAVWYQDEEIDKTRENNERTMKDMLIADND